MTDDVPAFLADDVECTAGPESLELVMAERVGTAELPTAPVGLGESTGHRRVRGQLGQVEDRDEVVFADDVVRRRIGEGQREETLLLQVRLMDPGEGAGQDHEPAAVPGFHGGM